MAISLTDSAASRVHEFLKKRENTLGLRFGVKKTGCSGLAYVVDFIDSMATNDIEFISHDIK